MKGSFINPVTGKRVSGAAAQQMIIKNNGGWDSHHLKYAESVANRVAQEMTEKFLNESSKNMRRAAFRLVK